jgi:propionyl-CoA carboxylase alpha chain
VIRGPGHNIPFLSAVLANPRFAEGRLTTNFIAEEYGERFQGLRLDALRLRELAAVAVAMRAREEARALDRRPPAGLDVQAHDRVAGRAGRRDPRRDPRSDSPGAGGVAVASGAGVAVTVEGNRLDVALDGWRPGLRLVRASIGGCSLSSRLTRSPRVGC